MNMDSFATADDNLLELMLAEENDFSFVSDLFCQSTWLLDSDNNNWLHAFSSDASDVVEYELPSLEICAPVSVVDAKNYVVKANPAKRQKTEGRVRAVRTKAVKATAVNVNAEVVEMGVQVELSDDDLICIEEAELDFSSHSTASDATDKSSSSTRAPKNCSWEGCHKFPQGRTLFCIQHGGGRRCTVPDCNKGARDRFFCVGHGGGRRCAAESCAKSAVGGSDMCSMHGGGKKCTAEGCLKSAQSATSLCVAHGGGKSCTFEGCSKVARGKTPFCSGHGGGARCCVVGCGRASTGKNKNCRLHASEEPVAK